MFCKIKKIWEESDEIIIKEMKEGRKKIEEKLEKIHCTQQSSQKELLSIMK